MIPQSQQRRETYAGISRSEARYPKTVRGNLLYAKIVSISVPTQHSVSDHNQGYPHMKKYLDAILASLLASESLSANGCASGYASNSLVASQADTSFSIPEPSLIRTQSKAHQRKSKLKNVCSRESLDELDAELVSNWFMAMSSQGFMFPLKCTTAALRISSMLMLGLYPSPRTCHDLSSGFVVE